MRVLKEGTTIYEGSLEDCWAFIRERKILVKGKVLVNEMEINSEKPNLLPPEYTVCARAEEL